MRIKAREDKIIENDPKRKTPSRSSFCIYLSLYLFLSIKKKRIYIKVTNYWKSNLKVAPSSIPEEMIVSPYTNSFIANFVNRGILIPPLKDEIFCQLVRFFFFFFNFFYI
jgi:hypothetical protein